MSGTYSLMAVCDVFDTYIVRELQPPLEKLKPLGQKCNPCPVSMQPSRFIEAFDWLERSYFLTSSLMIQRAAAS